MVRSDRIFEIRLLFSRLKLPLSNSTGIRRTLTSHLGRGSFVLIVEKGVVALSRGRPIRLHAFFYL